jgi:DNA polymerase-3 subunit beta
MLPDIKADKSISISQFTLKEMIRQTIFSISDNEANKILTGELFEINEDEFKIASLDLLRVSIRKIHLKEKYEHIKVVIPGKTLNEVSKILSGEIDDEVTISFSRNHVLFEFGETKVVSRLIEGNFYNIDQMLKNNFETKVKINKNDFFGCIDRATLLLRESEKSPVILSIRDTEIQMEMNTKIGSMDEEVTAQKEGKDVKIAFNPKYFIDVLKVIDEEEISLYLFNSNAPCFIKNDDESYFYLIMPINMN